MDVFRWVWLNWPGDSGQKIKMWKFYRRTKTTDKSRSDRKIKHEAQEGHIAHMRNRSPWKRTWPFITWIYFIQGCLVPCLVEIGSVVREKKIFKFRQYIFDYFPSYVIISPCKRTWSFIWTNMKPLHPKMLCTKLGWNWPRFLRRRKCEKESGRIR